MTSTLFASTRELLHKAQRGKYAVGHFNVNNLEIVQGVVAAAQRLKSPVVLATSEGAIGYAGMKYLYAIAQIAAQESKIPIALHLDHGGDMNVVRSAIRLGYSSVMIDASHEEFEKNVTLTRKIVKLAHARGVSVEAELGTIGGVEDTVSARHILYTDSRLAKEFVERTGCDSLAIAIGTSHGAYKFAGRTVLDLKRLQLIRARVKVPLVLHGASGVSRSVVMMAQRYGAKLKGVQGVADGQIRQAIRAGICKINTDTDLRLAFDAGLRKVVQTKPDDFDPRHMLAPAREMIQKVVEQRIRLFGSGGKA